MTDKNKVTRDELSKTVRRNERVLKLIVALSCGILPWVGVLVGGYITPWIASWFNVQMTFTEGMILSGIIWLMAKDLEQDAKREGVL